MNKLSWEEYALKIAEVAALRSADPYIQVGACLLRHDNSIAGAGFNGFPAGMAEDWSNREERRKYVCHAEVNALRYVRPGECKLIATTLLPCNDCLKQIAAFSIPLIVYKDIYQRDDSTLELAEKFGIKLVKIN